MTMRTILFAGAILALCASAAAAEPTTLKFGFTSPPTSYINVYGAEPWSKEVEEASQGTLKIQMYFNNILGNVTNIYDRTINHVVDISFGTLGNVGLFPKSEVTSLPFEADNPLEASLALYRLHASGVIADEFKAVKVLTLFTFSSSALHITKQIQTMEDMKGLKLAGLSKILSDEQVLLGAVPITMAPAETYQSIMRGTVAGTNMSWPAVISFKLDEVTKHHLQVPFGLAGAYFFMNKEAFAALPAAAQKAIDRYSGEALTKRLGGGGIAIDKESIAKVAAQPGHTIGTLAPEERERWRKTLLPVIEEWTKATPGGAAVLAAYRQEVQKVRAEVGQAGAAK